MYDCLSHHPDAVSVAEFLVLFLLPLGRPRGLLAGVSAVLALGDSKTVRFEPAVEGDTAFAVLSEEFEALAGPVDDACRSAKFSSTPLSDADIAPSLSLLLLINSRYSTLRLVASSVSLGFFQQPNRAGMRWLQAG